MPPDPFQNPGNLCYFNALIQCLLAATRKARFFNRPGPVNMVMVEEMAARLKRPMPTTPECASEYYTLFMDAFKEQQTFCRQFQGKTRTRLLCERGHQADSLTETNIFFVPNVPNAIQALFQPKAEPLDSPCECGATRVMATEMAFLPQILVIAIHKYDAPNQVILPLTLPTGHRLTATAHHAGGHYAASVHRDGQWWIANDAAISPGHLSKASVSMCFYSKK